MPRPPAVLVLLGACATFGTHAATCSAQSPATRTPVIELYTSEGCSSCPPADRWLSGLKTAAAEGKVVAQAFHVGYWDYIGWIDRFAAPAHTQRQRQVAAANRLRNIYTPQVVRDGEDWRDYGRTRPAARDNALVALRLERPQPDLVEAQVAPASAGQAWTAYWTVTEHGHRSKVTAGENSGELLQHDFVVRQYVPVGQYRGAQKLVFRPLAATPGHAQQVNLVVLEPGSGRTLQGLSLQCPV